MYSPSGTSTDTATLAGLEACPTYSGPSTMQELGLNGFVPVTFPQNAWALSTVLGCLQPQPVTLTGQGGVTVIDADGSPETGSGSQLTPADLAPPGKTDFNNPAEGPVVSDLGTAIRYDRPWRGSSQGQPDYDYSDQVTTGSPNGQATPVEIEVFEGPLLTVTVSASRTTVSAGQPVTLGATVTGAGDSALSYSWNFDGGAPGSEAPSPQVTFGSAGQYNVTVQVTDSQGGGGVASIPITVGTPPAPATGGHKQKGAGKNKKSHSPTGPVKSSGTHAGAKAGKQNTGHSTTSGKQHHNHQLEHHHDDVNQHVDRHHPFAEHRVPRIHCPSHDGVEETNDQRPSCAPDHAAAPVGVDRGRPAGQRRDAAPVRREPPRPYRPVAAVDGATRPTGDPGVAPADDRRRFRGPAAPGAWSRTRAAGSPRPADAARRQLRSWSSSPSRP